jgi:8-oxo-dGTP pyrophosphatase MutT (NUDIX family)
VESLRAELRHALNAERPPLDFPGLGIAQWREAAVVVPVLAESKTLRLLVIQRPRTLRTHAGQFAFPGGARDGEESLQAAGLRELDEELGLTAAEVELLGALPETPTSSHYRVTPFVGWVDRPVTLRPAAAEVDRVLEIPLHALLKEPHHWTELRRYEGRDYPVHFFDYGGAVIWGATGLMLWNFIQCVAALPAAKEL